ncbi:MAG: MFS transporter [bacterium]
MTTSDKLITRQLILNWSTRVLFFLSLSSLLPTLPNYLIDIGGNKSQVGMVMSAFALGVLLFRPLIGRQIDSVGRKIVLIIGILIFVISPLLYLFIQSIATLIPIRIFHGLGLAAFGTASITLITDAAPVKKRGEVISYTGMVNTVAFSLGPILGSIIDELWGYQVLFGTVSVLGFVCLLCAFFLHETKSHTTAKTRISYAKAILQRRIILSFVIFFLIAMTHGGVIFFIPIFLKEYIPVNIGLFFAVFGTSTLLIRIFVGKVSDRWGRGPLIVFALLFLTLGVFLLSQATNLIMLFTAAVLYGLGFGAQQPTLTALVADSTTNETRGKIFSFYYGGFDLGISITGLLLGAVAETFGLNAMFFVCSGLTLTAFVIFIAFFETSISQSLRCAFNLQEPGKPYYLCDDLMEVPPEQVEEYFKNT